MLELGNRKVRGQRRLPPFLALNAYTNISGLNHGHVVAAIADRRTALLGVPLEQAYNEGFLRWRAPATHYRRTSHRHFQKLARTDTDTDTPPHTTHASAQLWRVR